MRADVLRLHQVIVHLHDWSAPRGRSRPTARTPARDCAAAAPRPSGSSSRRMRISIEPGDVLAQRLAEPQLLRPLDVVADGRRVDAGPRESRARRAIWTVLSSMTREPAAQASTMFCASCACGPAAGPTGDLRAMAVHVDATDRARRAGATPCAAADRRATPGAAGSTSTRCSSSAKGIGRSSAMTGALRGMSRSGIPGEAHPCQLT